MMLYLCKRESGKWCTAPEAEATIPPFVMISGPYQAPDARERADELNLRHFPWKKQRKKNWA